MSVVLKNRTEQSRGHLLGGFLLLIVGHLLACSWLPGSWRPAWFVYLALIQFVYVFPLSYFVSRMGWRSTWIGLWLGVLLTLLLAVVIGVGSWLAQGHKLGFAGL